MCAELCEGSSYTAKIPNLLLSKRMGFVGLGFFYTNKIFQSAKQIPALEVEIGHKCCLFSPWFCWNSHVEVSLGCSPSLCQCDGEEGWPSSSGDHPPRSISAKSCTQSVKILGIQSFLRRFGSRNSLYTDLTGEL